MKKTFRTILAGAVALLAVSCYDDSDLRGQLGDLDERLDKVEATLNAETGGIADLLGRIETLEGKIAAIKVETVDGLTTLTLSDGSSVALSKNGVLTIVDDGWATVAANGTVTPLNIKVDHPRLAFKVEGGELKVSYDGTTYEATGVKVSEYTAHVIGDVVVAEDGKSVTVTIGDKNLELPLVTKDVAALGLSRDNFFLRYSAEKTVEITAENLSEIYVMNEPDGWKAVIEGNTLTISSPSKKAVDSDAAHAEGLVLIHATDADGKCVVAALEVSTGKGLTIDIDKEGTLTFMNAYTATVRNSDTGMESFGFANFYVGIADAAEFVNDPKAYLQPLYDEGWLMGDYGMLYNNWDLEFEPYQEGVYEEDVVEMTIDALSNWLTYDDCPYGIGKAIWVVPCDDKGIVMLDEIEYVTYTKFDHNVTVENLTHKDGQLSLALKGATKFYVELIDASFEQYGATLADYMSEGGLWMYLQQPEYLPMYGGTALSDGEYEMSLSQLNYDEPLKFNTKYYLIVFPYVEGTVYTDFEAQFMPYVKIFNSLPLQSGGSYAATFSDDKVTYSSVATTINLAENVESVYYSFYSVEEWSEFEDAGGQAVIDALFVDCYSPLTESKVVSENYLNSGESVILATLSVGVDGKYGSVVTKSLTTLAVPTEVNEAHTVTFADAVIDYTSISVNITPATGVTAYYNYMTETNLANYATEAELVAFMVTKDSAEAAKDVKKSYIAAGDSWTLVVVAVGADNKYNIYKQPYTTKQYPYSADMKVSIDGKLTYDGESKPKTVSATFNVEGADKLAVYVGYSGSTSSFVSTVVSEGAGGSKTGYKFVDVVDGKATVELNENVYGDFMVVYAAGYTVADGAVNALSAEPLTLTISENI